MKPICGKANCTISIIYARININNGTIIVTNSPNTHGQNTRFFVPVCFNFCSCRTDPRRPHQPCQFRRTTDRHLAEHLAEYLEEIQPEAIDQIRADRASRADPGRTSTATWPNTWRISGPGHRSDPRRPRRPRRSRQNLGRHLVEHLEEILPELPNRSAPAAPILANRRPPPGRTLEGDPTGSHRADPRRPRQPRRSWQNLGRLLIEYMKEIRPELPNGSTPTAPAVPIPANRRPPPGRTPGGDTHTEKVKEAKKNTPTVSGGGLGGTVTQTVLASERKPDKYTKKSVSDAIFRKTPFLSPGSRCRAWF